MFREIICETSHGTGEPHHACLEPINGCELLLERRTQWDLHSSEIKGQSGDALRHMSSVNLLTCFCLSAVVSPLTLSNSSPLPFSSLTLPLPRSLTVPGWDESSKREKKGEEVCSRVLYMHMCLCDSS